MSKWAISAIVSVIVIVLGFFIVSLILASVHGHDIVSEWQSWGKVVQDGVEETAKMLSRIKVLK